ncbi:hypothetical protein GWI33_017812 [Rhynchophorus ferrugineus]|uniref:Uncharacterized protein n=1 Tax=Rhynchophorus ferrugineus TaxID=354439 RepID=A0A834I8K0_RHYFE|nr:hypothetical protein GWI33_017812 [Rhynchophorus ferrugineus]
MAEVAVAVRSFADQILTQRSGVCDAGGPFDSPNRGIPAEEDGNVRKKDTVDGICHRSGTVSARHISG